MALSRLQRHKLVDKGAKLIPIRETAVSILQHAPGIEPGNIDLNGPALTLWSNIVRYVDEHDLVEPLLEIMMEKYPGDLELMDLKAEIARQSLPALVEHLKFAIESRKCVLFLGPRIFRCVAGEKAEPFNIYLARQLALELDRYGIHFEPAKDDKPELSYIIDRYETREKFIPGEVEVFAKRKYEDASLIYRTYELISKLDFPLIINTNPDTIFQDQYGKPNVLYGHYDMTNTGLRMLEPTDPGMPVIYNIYGSFVNPYSILFTEKEAVQFAKNTYEKNPPIPTAIKEITSTCYGLFLGFDFRDWHLKILFDVLDLRNKPGNYAVYEDGINVHEYDKEYYERRYNMTFLKFSANFYTQDFLNMLV